MAVVINLTGASTYSLRSLSVNFLVSKSFFCHDLQQIEGCSHGCKTIFYTERVFKFVSGRFTDEFI